MEHGQPVVFGPFRIGPVQHQLWRGEEAVALQRRPLAVLQYLIAHADRVVSKDELRREVWAGVSVTRAAVKVAVRAIRKALGEEADAPIYIETVGQEGYRFVDPATTARPPGPAVAREVAAERPIVGRETELQHLWHWYEETQQGSRQLIFVTGAPGIGKTTLMELFGAQLRAQGQAWLGWGQCVEQFGEGEAYLPVLAALGELGRADRSSSLVSVLRRFAPTWLSHLPALVDEAEREALQAHVATSTQQRMLREMAEALEQITIIQPLVLIFEDLQWSDHATLALLSYLAQRREQAHLLVLGTYRPVDVVMTNHPLRRVKQELQARSQCHELRVELLNEAQIRTYLSQRFADAALATHLAPEIYRRTDGHALFMTTMVEDLISQAIVSQEDTGWVIRGDLAEVQTPEGIRQLIDHQVERLGDEEQRVLAAASVVGVTFSVTEVATALKREGEEIEVLCEEAVEHGQFIEELGVAEWPDGTISGHYQFRHTLYQEAFYSRVPETRRMRWHRRIGERIEAGYGQRAVERATELAVHFERGREYPRAVQYLKQSGQSAARRYAYQEVIGQLTKGLALLQRLPASSDARKQELELQAALIPAVVATKGYATPEAETHLTRIQDLLVDNGETASPQVGPDALGTLDRLIKGGADAWQGLMRRGIRHVGFPTLIGLAAFHMSRGELQTASTLGEQCLKLTQRAQDPALLLATRVLLGITLFYRGEFTAAREHLEQVIARYDPQKHHSVVSRYAYDPGVLSWSMACIVLIVLGYPEQARNSRGAALVLAQELGHAFSQCFAFGSIAIGHQFLREAGSTQEQTEALLALAHTQGFPFWVAIGTNLQGWARAEQGRQEAGMAELQQGLTAHRATRALAGRTYYLALLAEIQGKRGQTEAGLATVAEAQEMVGKNGERVYEAELYRLKGELLLQATAQEAGLTNRVSQLNIRDQKNGLSQTAEAEACFQQALDVARNQSARWWELRGATSLARLWHQQGKTTEARDLLAPVYHWFMEGLDTADVKEAKALLTKLV